MFAFWTDERKNAVSSFLTNKSHNRKRFKSQKSEIQQPYMFILPGIFLRYLQVKGAWPADSDYSDLFFCLFSIFIHPFFMMNRSEPANSHSFKDLEKKNVYFRAPSGRPITAHQAVSQCVSVCINLTCLSLLLSAHRHRSPSSPAPSGHSPVLRGQASDGGHHRHSSGLWEIQRRRLQVRVDRQTRSHEKYSIPKVFWFT